MPEFDAKAEILALWKQPTERDLQVKVGASNLGQPCPRCLAEDLARMLKGGEFIEPEPSPFWLGAAMGTAMHHEFENLIKERRPAWSPEQKVILGHLEGYGTIKSTLDLYVPAHKSVVDFKSTTRAKLKNLKEALTTEPTEFDTTAVAEARYKATSYIYQLMLYAKAKEDEGCPVEWVHILFVCRDGVGDSDLWSHPMPYDRALAEKAWDRLERLWAVLREGRAPDTLPSDPHCWTCRHRD